MTIPIQLTIKTPQKEIEKHVCLPTNVLMYTTHAATDQVIIWQHACVEREVSVSAGLNVLSLWYRLSLPCHAVDVASSLQFKCFLHQTAGPAQGDRATVAKGIALVDEETGQVAVKRLNDLCALPLTHSDKCMYTHTCVPHTHT